LRVVAICGYNAWDGRAKEWKFANGRE